MSFTAEVKDELSRKHGPAIAEVAQLAALIRICGSLSFSGSGHYSIRVSTETGSVARIVLKYTHELLNLETTLTTRHSVLHKTRNYLIEIPNQAKLAEDLIQLGILVPGKGLASGIPEQLLKTDEAQRAFLRGAFMAGGFIADPRGDFHLEIAVTGEGLAQGILRLMKDQGVTARLNHRRGLFAIYLKSYEDIVRLLKAMGAPRSAHTVETIRKMKSVKNDVNRKVNAEIANSNRSSDAAVQQLILIGKAQRLIGVENLPPALREFCRLRRKYPELSLSALGEHCNPTASKSALFHRVLRLQNLVKEAQEQASAAKSEKNENEKIR